MTLEFKGAAKLYFTRYLCAAITLFNTGLHKFAFSTHLFGKLVILSFCTFCVYFFYVELDVIFLNIYNTCIIIVCVRCFCSLFLDAICKKLIACHKNLITALNKKYMPLGSFRVLKI